MSNSWIQAKLGDHIDLITGFPFKSAKYTESQSDIRLLRGDNVAQQYVRWDGVKRWPSPENLDVENYLLGRGDIVLAMDRPWISAGLKVARLTSEDVPSLLVQRVSRIRGSKSFDTGFLYHVLCSPNFTNYVQGVQTGTGIPHISAQQIKDFKFLLPPLQIQRRIADVLGALDDKIELNRRMNETLEQMAMALYKHWFVDFGPFQDGEFVDSELGMIPKGWDVVALGDAVSVNERSVSRSYPYTTIQYVDISSVEAGRLGETTQYEASNAPSRAKRLVQHDDVIWSCVRPNRKSYLLIHKPADNLVVSTGFAVLTPKHVPSSFVYAHTTRTEFVEYLTNNADGSAYPAVRADIFSAARMIKAPTSVLDEYDRIASSLYALVCENESESKRLSELRDYLLPRLLSGEILLEALKTS